MGGACCGPADPLTAKYRLGLVLGRGKFATVRSCTNRRTGTAYAAKIIDKALVPEPLQHTLKSEVEILKKLDHPNIIKVWR